MPETMSTVVETSLRIEKDSIAKHLILFVKLKDNCQNYGLTEKYSK